MSGNLKRKCSLECEELSYSSQKRFCENFSQKCFCEMEKTCIECLESMRTDIATDIVVINGLIDQIDHVLEKESEIDRIIRLCEEKLEKEKDPWRRMVILNMYHMAIEEQY